MKNIISHHKVILSCIFIIISLCCAFLLYKTHQNRLELKKLAMKQNGIAIYVKQNGSYIRYNNETFPTGKTLNTTKSVCLNNNGDIVNVPFSANSNKITITSDGTAYCTLYFD